MAILSQPEMNQKLQALAAQRDRNIVILGDRFESGLVCLAQYKQVIGLQNRIENLNDGLARLERYQNAFRIKK